MANVEIGLEQVADSTTTQAIVELYHTAMAESRLEGYPNWAERERILRATIGLTKEQSRQIVTAFMSGGVAGDHLFEFESIPEMVDRGAASNG